MYQHHYKFNHCWLTIMSLALVLCSRAIAQPPARITVPLVNPPEAVGIEDAVARQLRRLKQAEPAEVPGLVVAAFGEGDIAAAALGVAGADAKSPELKKVQEIVEFLGAPVPWKVRFDEEITVPLPDTATETTVTVRVGVADGIDLNLWRDEKIVLRREEVPQGKFWRIVPEQPETFFTKRLQDSPDVGLVRRLATYLAYPQATYEMLAPRMSIAQVKQLGLALMQYTQDWNEKFPAKITTFREQLKPYLKQQTAFTAPGDAAKKQSYSFNPELVGRNLADLEAPAETVAIYLGRDKNPEFRFDGQTVIGFADGHVLLMEAEEAKKLRWKP